MLQVGVLGLLGLCTAADVKQASFNGCLGAPDCKEGFADLETLDDESLLQVSRTHFSAEAEPSEMLQHNATGARRSFSTGSGSSTSIEGKDDGNSKSTLRKSEFMALVPTDIDYVNPHYVLQWIKLEYPAGGVPATSKVSMTKVTSPTPELGHWYDLDVGFGSLVTGKIFGDNFYMLANRSLAFYPPYSCCADTLQVYPKDGSKRRDIDLQPLVQQAIPDFGFPPGFAADFALPWRRSWDGRAHATHTFQVLMIDGMPHAICLVQYVERQLCNQLVDAIIVINLVDETLKPTADGDLAFRFFQKIGTLDDSEDATRFKVQYVNETLEDRTQWHANGVERFTTRSGVNVLAITMFTKAEAILLKDPWTYTSANGGGKILQRFGCPTQWKNGKRTTITRSFGADSKHGPKPPLTAAGLGHGGLHNVFYQAKADAPETLTVFANGVGFDSYSHVFEFEINLVDEDQMATSDDVFRTKFTSAPFTFRADVQGGARPLGSGMWIAASGTSLDIDFEIVDREGKNLSITGYKIPKGKTGFYDPFVYIG